MDQTLDELAAATRETVRSVLARQSDLSAVRVAEPLGHDPKLWTELCSLGLPGLGVDERLGGAGANLPALVVAAIELGTIMAPVPFPEHAVAARLLASCAPDHPDLAAVVSGELIATFGMHVCARLALTVSAGAIADVVIARIEDDLVAVRAEAPGRALTNLGCLPVADRDLGAGQSTVIASGQQAAAALDTAYHEWMTLVAGWLAGLSDAALAMTTAWVKERYQFGVPIGSFQGVQHGLADLPGMVEGAQLLAHEAAWAVETGELSLTGAGADELAQMALLFSAETAARVTGRLVQYHGGLGVSEEHDAQLFYRRARAYPLLAGPPRQMLRTLGAQLLADRKS
jgi:alkylation response protein AidB-like acyl-CoA dehydrogenase